QIQRQNINIATGDIKENEGIYDPELNFSISYSDSEIPSVSTFIESGTINEQIFDVSSGISGKLPYGTFYNLFEFGVTRNETDSPLETLSPNWSTNLGFSVGQELLRGFSLDSNKVSIVISKINRDKTIYELEKTISDVILQVEKDYWNAVAALENLKLEQKAYELAVDLVNRNKIQVEVGVLPKVSLTQAESEVASRLVDLINAENVLKKRKDILKNRLSIDLNTEINLTDSPTTEALYLNEHNIIDIALKKRPEIKQSEQTIKINEELKKFYSNQRLPRLAIEGTLNYQGIGGDENDNRLTFTDNPSPIPSQFDDPSDAFDNLAEFNFPSWSVLGVFSFPLFNREANGAYIKANAEHIRSMIEQKKLKDEIKLDVRNAIREIKSNRKELEAVKLSVNLAEEVLSNEEEKFKVGLSTTRDILETQRDLIDSKIKQIRAVLDYNKSLAEYEKAIGTILENNSIILNY
ncbi:MAG: TolC family protein, partial [Candidatus Dadabacteria bacterium]|nr:TolC family protein [Candidatus Dadabacteria bacterium]NIQ14943.1 TolC family protein [Candidatus Dadabacteria bacterium]